MAENGDVPSVLRFDGKKWPLGRYLKARLREESGYEQPMGSDGLSRDQISTGYRLRLEELQWELASIEAREKRESVRRGHSATAEARLKIAELKRTI